MQKKTAGNETSETVLRWIAVGLALALFAGVAACRDDGGAEAEPMQIAAMDGSEPIPLGVEALAEGDETIQAQTVAQGEEPTEDPVAAEREQASEPEPDGDHASAAVETVRTPATRPDTPWDQYMLGVSAWQEGELGEAERHLREWVGHAPDDVKGRVNLARVLIEIGRSREAREHAAIAENLDPGSGAAKRILARALDESGDCASSLAKYEEALWIDPEDRWSLNNLGYLLIRHGRYQDAIGPLALAVQLDSMNAMFRGNLIAALEGAGHQFAAREALDAAPLAETYQRELLGAPRGDDVPPIECPW